MLFGLTGLEPGERLTLALMYCMSRANTLVCWKSTHDLAEASGYTDRAILKHLTKLREQGLIVDCQEPDPRGGEFRGFRLIHDLRGEPVAEVEETGS